MTNFEKWKRDLTIDKLIEWGIIYQVPPEKCKLNVSENSGENMKFGVTFIRGCNNPRKLLGEIPTSPVKNQAHENEPLSGSKKFRVRQGMPDFRPVEEGVQGTALSLPAKQELCTCSTEEVENGI